MRPWQKRRSSGLNELTVEDDTQMLRPKVYRNIAARFFAVGVGSVHLNNWVPFIPPNEGGFTWSNLP